MSPYIALRFPTGRPGSKLNAGDLVAFLSEEFRKGSLPPGSRLPPLRTIAHQLGISKNTAHAAFEELVERGLLESRHRLGYFLPEARTPKDTSVARPFEVPEAPLTPPSHVWPKTPDKNTICLSRVLIDPELLPREKIAACLRSVLRSPGLKFAFDVQGYAPLREAIAQHVRRRGLPIEASDIILTVGSQQALDLVSRALANKKVATENPAYHTGKALMEMHGLKLSGLNVNPFEGMDRAHWNKTLRSERPGLVYVTSRFQNPTGYSYSQDELLQILDWSRELGFGLLEDDWGSDMLSYSEFRPCLRSLGGRGVLYMNSFTKKLWPSLRLGYLAANEKTLPALLEAKRVACLGSPNLLEAALFEFLDRGYYEQHLRTLHTELDRRYHRALELLRGLMPEGVRWTQPGGGAVMWIELPPEVSMPELREAALRRGVDIDGRRGAFFGTPHLHGFFLAYAYVPSDKLERGLSIVAEEITARRNRSSTRPRATDSTTRPSSRPSRLREASASR